jgi:hypothetical protein
MRRCKFSALDRKNVLPNLELGAVSVKPMSEAEEQAFCVVEHSTPLRSA